jgi:WD40 repeat protein
MRTGLKCPWYALVCLIVAGDALSLHADDNASPHLRYLWKSPHHSNGITRAVLFAADGAQVVSAGDDGTVKFLRRSDGGVITNVTAHSGSVYGLALSADGSLIASGGQDGLLKIWRATDAAPLRSFLAHTSIVASVAFSPDGSLVASGGGPDNQLKIWRVADGELVRTITAKTHRGMLSVAFSPDGRFVAGSGPVIWLLNDGSLVRTLGDSGADDVKFSPDGSRICVQQHYTIFVVNLNNGLLEPVPSPSFRPWSAFSPDGVSLFSVSVSGETAWADFRSRTAITNYCSGVEPCFYSDRYSSVAFDPQMRAVALGTEAGDVVLAELPLWVSHIQHAGANLTIQWQGGTGPFQLQSNREVGSQTWEDIGPPVTGSTVSAPVSASSAFYRVRDLSR